MFKIRWSTVVFAVAAGWVAGNLAWAKDKDERHKGHTPAHRAQHTAPQRTPAAAPVHVPAQAVAKPIQQIHVNQSAPQRQPQHTPRVHVPHQQQQQVQAVQAPQVQQPRLQVPRGNSQIQLTQQQGTPKTHVPGKVHVPQNTPQPVNPPKIQIPNNVPNAGGSSAPGLGVQPQPKVILPPPGAGQQGAGVHHGGSHQPGTNKLPQFNPNQTGKPTLPNPPGNSNVIPNSPALNTTPQREPRHQPGRTEVPGLKHNPNTNIPGAAGSQPGLGNLPGNTQPGNATPGNTNLVPNNPTLKTIPQHEPRHQPGRTEVPGLKHNPNSNIPGATGSQPGLGNLPGNTQPGNTTPGNTNLVPNNPTLKTIPQHELRHQPGRTEVPGLKHNPNSNIPGASGFQPGVGNLPGNTDAGNKGHFRNEHLPMKVETPIAGVQKHTIPLNIPKNGHTIPWTTKDLGGAKLRDPGSGRNQDQLQFLMRSRDHQELRHNLENLKHSPEFQKNPQLAHLNIDKISGLHQERLQHGQSFDHWRHANVGQQLNLDRQFQLQRHGDLTRQMNFTTNIINTGGWQHRQHGAVAASFTTSSFSVWYAGGGCYPRHCWYPRWSPWVSWCWWDTCVPFYDPRPIYCRPIVYQPCQPWVYYEYPAWQPLPVVACGTWVDVAPVAVPAGMDLQMLAVRFVDNGHPEQNLGPRYRVWVRNNSPVQITAPFSVLALAGNDLSPSADLPQAGVVIPTMDIGEIRPVDLRLPLAANRLGLTPEGHRVPFNYLHVLVDSHQQVGEIDETNNGSVVSRTDILPVDPAAFSTDLTAASPGATLTIAGEGFGPEPGRVLVSVGGQQTEALIQGWYDLGIRFTVPGYNLTGTVDADILVVRGDGAVSNPLDLDLAPQGLIGAPEDIPGAPIPDAPQ